MNEAIQATTAEELEIEEDDVILDADDSFVVTDVSEGNYVEAIDEDDNYTARIAVRDIAVCESCGHYTVNSTHNPNTKVMCFECLLDRKYTDVLNAFDTIRRQVNRMEDNVL